MTGDPQSGQTVLVVDDEQIVRDPLASMLKRGGYNILTAGDRQETVSVFEENADEIVAVLLDYHMPDCTGIDIFAELQELRPEIPVIMMSGFVESTTQVRFLGMGVVGFLQKPLRYDTLMHNVQKAADGRAA